MEPRVRFLKEFVHHGETVTTFVTRFTVLLAVLLQPGRIACRRVIAMFDGAMFSTGQEVCKVLTHMFPDRDISACDGHEQAIGSITVMWTALLLVFWRLFPTQR
jgi:hypothetical protein